MFKYRLGNHEQPLEPFWREEDVLTTGEFAALSVERAFESGTTTGLWEQDYRIAQAEKAAETYAPTAYAGGMKQENTDPFSDMWQEYMGTLTAENNPHAMSQEEWKQSPYFREKITYTPNMTPQRAQILVEDFDERRYQDALLARGSKTWTRKVLGFGAAMIGSLPDPLNFIPIFGAAGRGASVGARALRAAGEGAVSTALIDAAIALPVDITTLRLVNILK